MRHWFKDWTDDGGCAIVGLLLFGCVAVLGVTLSAIYGKDDTPAKCCTTCQCKEVSE